MTELTTTDTILKDHLCLILKTVDIHSFILLFGTKDKNKQYIKKIIIMLFISRIKKQKQKVEKNTLYMKRSLD